MPFCRVIAHSAPLADVWENKSWWLMPIVLALALLGMLIALAGSAAAVPVPVKNLSA
jgi:hypothetical protein